MKIHGREVPKYMESDLLALAKALADVNIANCDSAVEQIYEFIEKYDADLEGYREFRRFKHDLYKLARAMKISKKIGVLKTFDVIRERMSKFLVENLNRCGE